MVYGLNIKVLRKQSAIASAVNWRMADTVNGLCVKKFCSERVVVLRGLFLSESHLTLYVLGYAEASVYEENETKKARRLAEP